MNIVIMTESRADWPGLNQVYKEGVLKGHRVNLYCPFEGSWFTGKRIASFSLLKKEKPDWVILLGDRKRVLIQAIQIREAGLKIAHISGGDKQEAKLIDEECRSSLTIFSNLHFVTNQESEKRVTKLLSSLGREDKVVLSGSPFVDAIINFQPRKVNVGEYVTALVNPEPDYLAIYDYLIDHYKPNQIVFIEPNSDYGLKERDKLREKILKKGHCYTDNLDQYAFLNLVWNSRYFIGNSSAMVLELQYTGVPCLSVGTRNRDRLEAFESNLIKLDCLSRRADYLLDSIERNIADYDFRREEGLRADYKKGNYGEGTSRRIIIKTLEKITKER